MAIEPKRGCGYRKVGGLYLMSGKFSRPCGRLPMELTVCPACGAGIKQSRGWTWIEPSKLFVKQRCKLDEVFVCPSCPMYDLTLMEQAGLLWVGKSFYKTPAHFNMEADAMGVCRRISTIPRDFKLGEHWVFLAHPEAMPGKNEESEEVMVPGVFKLFKPERIEKIVTETQSKDEEEMEKLEKRGITPFVVPDDDPDHQGSAYDKEEKAA